MRIYYNSAQQNTFTVSNEYHQVINSRITLNYMPLVESITILGFTRSRSNEPSAGQYYIDDLNNQYVLGTPEIYFNSADNGKHLNVDYRGVPLVAEMKNSDEVRTAVKHLFPAKKQRVCSGKAEVTALFCGAPSKNNTTVADPADDMNPITIEDINSLFS